MIVETNIIANQKYRLQWSSILNWKLRMYNKFKTP